MSCSSGSSGSCSSVSVTVAASSVSRTSSDLSHLPVPIQRFVFILWAIVTVGSTYLMLYKIVCEPSFQQSSEQKPSVNNQASPEYSPSLSQALSNTPGN